MTIYYTDPSTGKNKELSITSRLEERSYRIRSINKSDAIYLYFALPYYVDIPIGAYVEYDGDRYEMMNPAEFTKNSSENFDYVLTFYAPWEKAKRYIFREIFLTDGGDISEYSPRIAFSYTAKPKDHVKMLVDNLNYRDPSKPWKVGDCLDAVEKTITYDHNTCYDALSMMAEAFEIEYEVLGNTINLRKVEYHKDDPLPLSYGKGNGFKPGTGRANYTQDLPVEALFVQGGDRNIDASKYGYDTLMLPAYYRLGYDGQHFSDEEEYDESKGRTYRAKDNQTITRWPEPLGTGQEDCIDCSHIYPSRVGEVTAVEQVADGWDFWDSTIPDSLDYSDQSLRVAGETVTVVFQSGVLSGQEFEIVQSETSTSGYIHNDPEYPDDPARKRGRFKLVSNTSSGETLPSERLHPNVGDKYAVFGIALPQAYIADNETKTGASWDMFREAIRYLYDAENYKFTFTGELDGNWARKNWGTIGYKIIPGSHVLFSDTQFQQEGTVVRITSVKDFIHKPYSPEIELSNSSTQGSFNNKINEIGQNEVKNEEANKNIIQQTKRGFLDAKETLKMLEKSLLANFTESISPITVQTMGLLVGDESLQFRFVDNNVGTPQVVTNDFKYDNNSGVLSIASGIIQHMTLGIDTISSSHEASEYKYWVMPAFSAQPTEGAFYVYAKVPQYEEGSYGAGTYVLSTVPISMNRVSGCYHLLMGILNSEYEGERSYVSLFGFTEILPGRIVTDRIASTDGKTFFDLLKGVIQGKITFTSGSSGLENLKEWQDKQQQIDAKNTVFRTQPVPPYKLDDLWADGEVLKICLKAKAKNETFDASDWGLATTYDNTQTAIDGGIVTTGTVRLAGDDGLINSGITGGGTESDSIRMWAGATEQNKESAPFQVRDDGSIKATKGIFSGYLQTQFIQLKDGAEYMGLGQYRVKDNLNLLCTSREENRDGTVSITLPSTTDYLGTYVNILDPNARTRSSTVTNYLVEGTILASVRYNILNPNARDEYGNSQFVTNISLMGAGAFLQLFAIPGLYDGEDYTPQITWVIINAVNCEIE